MATQDNLRCARCCLVVFDVFSEMMQELLARRGLPAQKIYDIVMNDVPFVQRLNDTEKKMLQSLSTDQVFSKLDSAIIYKIVKYFKNRQIIPIPSSTRWGQRPSDTDKDIGDDVERIHFARNDCAHKTDAAINESKFKEFFDTFINVGKRVDSYLQKDPNFNHERRIRDLKTTVLDTETTEKILEQRMEIEQLKKELEIQENKKEIEIYCSKGIEAVMQRFKELKEVGDNSLIRLKLILENVVDNDEIVNRFRSLLNEINRESTIELISIEKQCIELNVNINTFYLTNKDLLLGAVTQFLYILIAKQALIWKGNTVTVVIVIDEDYEEQEVFDETPFNSSSVVKETRNFEFKGKSSNKGSLVLDLGIKARDLRDGQLNQHLTSFIENLLKKSNGRELFEEKHVKASLIVEDSWDSGEADNEVLLKLADQQLNKGNPQDAKVSIGQVEARLDQDFHVIRTSKMTGHIENMMEEYSKRIGIQYKTCSLLLMKIPGSVFDAVRCFFIGLVCYGNPDLYKYKEISPDIWRRIHEEVIKNDKVAYNVMADLVNICFDLHRSHIMIILFMAFELAPKFVQLMSKLPENSKTNFYSLVQRCWLICANCHYILKEFNKAVEVLTLFNKDPRQCDNVDVLELWAFCLLGTKKYYLAKQKVEMAIKFAKTEIQKSRFQKLEEHLTQKMQRRETQSEENYDSENTSTKDSGYSYSSLIDLVESTNIDFEAEFEVDGVRNELSDTRSIADSQYSDLSNESFDDTASSASAKSRKKKKVRRKTRNLQRVQQINSSQNVSGSMPLKRLPVSHSLDRTEKWRNDHLDMKGHKYQNVNYDENKGDNHSENTSDGSSIASCTTMSLAGLSADEFSGSEYDVSDSGSDWYDSASDFHEESNNKEEISSEEQTYFQRSQVYHSGQIKARNILEREYFQKGLNLSDEFIEHVGSRYFKGKNNIYNDIGNKNFNEQCQKIPKMYKKCTISIESAHQAVCKPIEPKDEIQEICIAGRSKCGQTFTDDTVVVKIYSKKFLGKVHGEVVSLVKRNRYEDMDHPVFVCLLDTKIGHLMMPLCRTVPKLHILHSTVIDRFRKSSVEIYNYDADNHTLNLSHCHNVPEGEREQWLFIVAYIKWKPNKIYPLAAVIDVIHCSQNPHDGIRILSKEYQVPYFYEKSTVEGFKATFKAAKAFNINDYADITTNQRVFTIDSSGSTNLDNALSVKMLDDRYYAVGIHISDVTSIVKKDDLVDMEAKTRCVTFYPGKGFRPFAMLPEPLSESICSLLPNQKRPVISVYFKFDKNGNLAETMPIIQKSIIKSCKQFSYQEVQNILEDKLEEQQIELFQDVRMLYTFAKHLKEMRLGHASFSLPVEIDISEDENLMNTYKARSLVEEFMILTNHSIAKLLMKQYPGSVPLYCQQPPPNEVLENWYNMNHHYIYHVLGLQTMNTPRGKISVFHSPPEGRTKKLTPVQTWVLEEIKDLVAENEQNISRIKQLIQSDFLHPKQALAYHEWNQFQEPSKYVCSSEILTSKDQGIYFGLGNRSYVHFTSPLRRYNDLVVHRLVSTMLKKETDPPYTPAEISDICLSMNDATKRAKQFSIDCKQFRFGRFFKNNPVLFNGFVKEISDNGLKILIPGLQNLPIFRKEIQFKILDVACKPEKGDDVEMLSMTNHEKERKMVVVKWEKRLYSYTHRTCRKPKPNQVPYEKNSFSPYLRIFPHQNTTFLRYKEHWIRILRFILEDNIDRLMVLLSNFKKEERTIKNILHDKDTVSSFKRSVTDVSSEVRQGIIVEHRCRFQVPYHHGQIIQLQMSASLNRGILTPTPQVLDVTENVKFCIDHFDNPIKALLRFAKFPTKSKYASIQDYVKTWIPIVEMESTINAVHSEDTAVINDIPVDFRGRRGRFVLTKGFCDIRDMDISSGMTEKLSAALIDGTEKIREEDSRNVDHRHGTTMASTIRAAVGTDIDDKISNTDETENVIIDIPSKEIKTKTLSEMEFIVHEIENRETEKKSNDGSSQKKKPKYSKVLSPHFLCIKLKRPLTENVKAKIGNILPNKSQYIWVAHGELLKSRSIRSKTYSERRGCFKKVVEIDLVFKLHKNSPSPPINKVSSNDKCSIELILKSKVFRRIECYIKLLGEASELAQNIALGHRISDLDLDYLRLCRTMNYEVDVPGFHPNNTKQDTAIMKALNSRFSLIQGPPGTGKTFTGVKLVYLFDKLNKLCQEKDEKRRRVIFCGPSNKSVDLVARMVLNKLGAKSPKIVRMYASAYEYLDFPVPGRAIISSRSMRDAKSDSDLKTKGVVLHHIIRSDGKPHANKIQEFDAKFHADNLIIKENEKLPYEQRKAVKTRLQDIYEYKSLLHTATVEELDNYDVIFCTTSMAGNPRLLTATKKQVAQVIIDECGMCSEPESMVPIISLRATQVVLIGDHKQLRPIIISREASELGLEKSLFERYSNDDSLMTMLEQQYRMNTSICEFPSRMFYDGKLKTAHENIGRPRKPLNMWRKSNNIPRVFCHVEGEEETLTVKTKEGNEQSRSNNREIEQVVKVFRHMVTVEGVNPETINVMSQYNAQCTALRVELKEKGFDKFNVTTVVSSQGGEWDYVIFSLVRSLPKYMIEKNPTEGWCIQNLGFITDRHQINVALTRAKKGLVIIGNKNLLVGDEVWRKLLEDYEMNDCIFDARQFP